MPRRTAKPTPPKPGKGQIVHDDPQQCPDHAGPHLHDLCACDPDVDDGNVRFHIRHVLDNHWPLQADQDVVICQVCKRAVRKTSTYKAALNYEPLETS